MFIFLITNDMGYVLLLALVFPYSCPNVTTNAHVQMHTHTHTQSHSHIHYLHSFNWVSFKTKLLPSLGSFCFPFLISTISGLIRHLCSPYNSFYFFYHRIELFHIPNVLLLWISKQEHVKLVTTSLTSLELNRMNTKASYVSLYS